MELSLVFFDTNIFIYLFEDQGVLGQEAARLVQRMGERGDQLLTSALTVGEILVKPRMTDPSLARRYDAFFRSSEVQVLCFDLQAAGRYADIRQDRSIRAPDAIQLSCASAARCDLFITNDEALTKKVIPGIQFIVTPDRSPI